MTTVQNFVIAATGCYFPKTELSAEDIDVRLGKTIGWTREHVGVLRRFECRPPETLASMAKCAVESALANAQMNWSDIDLILDCSTSIHRLIPCNASHIQACFAPDAYGIPCFDIQSTCLGFIVGMNVANALIGSGQHRNILLTCSERALSAANWNEPESAALLGDAAAAVVLKPRENSPSKICYAHETWSEHLEVCRVNGGNPNLPPYAYTPELDSEYRFHMDGRAVFKAAYKLLPPMFNRLVGESGINRDELYLIPHQASPKANTLVCRALKIREERFYGDIAHHGNLVAASIPVVLHHCLQNALIPKNSPVMLLGTSAGYSQAGLIFQL